MRPSGRETAEAASMLVVTANWCLSDGTLAAAPLRGPLRRLWREVERAARRQGFRHDGRYEPVPAVDVVLAGDTFDWLTSRAWLGAVRPWQSGGRASAARAGVVAAALARSVRLVGGLAARARRGLALPAADRRGRPVPGTVRRVPVRVTLLCGDRDRGLDREAALDFARGRGIAVGARWCDGATAVWHGEEVDPLAAESAGGATLNDTLAVELVARFAAEVADGAATRPAAGIAADLTRGHALDAPAALVRGLAALDRGGAVALRIRAELRDLWNRAVAGWHRSARRLGVRGAAGRDLVDPLAAWLALGTDFSARLMRPPPLPFVAAATDPPAPPVPLVLLGHPPAVLAGLPAWRGRVACLGGLGSAGSTAGGGAFAGAAGGEPAVAAAVVSAGGGPPRIEWLPGAAGSPTIGDTGPAGLGIWRSDDGPGRPQVLDAA